MTTDRHPSLRIRPLVPPDLREVLAIESGSFSPPWTEEMFLGELARGAVTRALVLEEREGGAWIIRGFVLAWLVEDELHVNDLAVEADHRRRGLAGRLIKELISLAVRGGARFATLEVRAGNLPAIALYTRNGFALTGRRRGYYPDGEDALILSRSL